MIPSFLGVCLILLSPKALSFDGSCLRTAHAAQTQDWPVLDLSPSQRSEIVEVHRVEIRQVSLSASSASISSGLPLITPSTKSRLVSSPTYNLLGWQAPDNTCGYVGGSLAKIKTCDSDAACDVITVAGGGVIVGCCQPNAGCDFFGSCVESAEYFSSNSLCIPNCASATDSWSCSSLCPQKPNTVICTNSNAPYCAGYSFSEWDASLYECAATPASSIKLMETTFDGQTNSRVWVPIFSSIGTSAPTATSLLLSGPTAEPTVVSISSGRPLPSRFTVILALLFVTGFASALEGLSWY